MRNAIILHGLADHEEYYDPSRPSGSNSHWLPWLQKQLMINNVKADTPEVPHPFKGDWDSWVREVERFDITPETMLVGHSMGGGFWVRYLSEHPELSVDKVILVAPWLNLAHEVDINFFDFTLDPSLTERVNQLIIFASDNDMIEVQNTVTFLQEKLPSATTKVFKNYGHFTLKSMGTQEFPELVSILLEK